jgi:hypothetical protein
LALKQEIQNYSLAQQAKENLIKRSGSTLVSQDVTKADDIAIDTPVAEQNEDGTPVYDDNGDVRMTTHKKKLERQIQRTGLGNNSNMGVIFSMLPLKAQALTAGLEKLNFDAHSAEDARKIMNKFNLPKELQNIDKDAASKFDDRKQGMQNVIQNICAPLGNKFLSNIVSYYNHPNKLELDFSHSPVFADDQETKTANMQALVDLYSTLAERKVINENEFKAKMKEHGIIG